MRIARRTSLEVMGLIVAVLGLTLGCGGSRATVEGNVTFDGKPVEQGAIVFEPANGQGSSVGGTIVNGKYLLGSEEKLTPGKVIVRISAVGPTGKKIEAGPPEPPGTLIDEVRQFIPPAYNDNSTLAVDVPAGRVTHHFELVSQPAPQ